MSEVVNQHSLALEPSWQKRLDAELKKEYFLRLCDWVQNERHVGKEIYPPDHEVFKALWKTPYSKVKVVIVGQDPYHGRGQANGLCFSVNRGVPFPPSLKNIFKEILNDVGSKTEKESDKKLKIYQRLIQLSLMGDEFSSSFKALFYTRAIDLGDVDAESQLLSRLKDPKALHMDCNREFSGWVCGRANPDIIMATADRFEKKLQKEFQYEPLESIAGLYLAAAKLGNVDAKTKFHDLYGRGLAGIDKSWQSRTCFNGFLAIYEKKQKTLKMQSFWSSWRESF